jgi:hypothetical protein
MRRARCQGMGAASRAALRGHRGRVDRRGRGGRRRRAAGLARAGPLRRVSASQPGWSDPGGSIWARVAGAGGRGTSAVPFLSPFGVAGAGFRVSAPAGSWRTGVRPERPASTSPTRLRARRSPTLRPAAAAPRPGAGAGGTRRVAAPSGRRRPRIAARSSSGSARRTRAPSTSRSSPLVAHLRGASRTVARRRRAKEISELEW